MAGNQAGKSNPASKRMMSAAKKAKRVKNKRKNEAMSGLLSDREHREYLRHKLDFMAAREKTEEWILFGDVPDYVHHECDICHSRRNHHVPKKEAPYTYDFGKWMANRHGTPGALKQERIMGRTIHYINEHPRATEAQIKAAVIFGLTRILDREAAEAL